MLRCSRGYYKNIEGTIELDRYFVSTYRPVRLVHPLFKPSMFEVDISEDISGSLGGIRMLQEKEGAEKM